MITDVTVAMTILEQLGGARFRAMTGAHDFVTSDNSVQFRLPNAQKGIRTVRITLNGNDLYDVEFGAVRKFEWKVISKFSDVFVDSLREIFEAETGLLTRM